MRKVVKEFFKQQHEGTKESLNLMQKLHKKAAVTSIIVISILLPWLNDHIFRFYHEYVFRSCLYSCLVFAAVFDVHRRRHYWRFSRPSFPLPSSVTCCHGNS